MTKTDIARARNLKHACDADERHDKHSLANKCARVMTLQSAIELTDCIDKYDELFGE